MYPEVQLDKLDTELWMEIITFDTPIKGTRTDCGLVLTGHSGQRKAGTKEPSWLVCWDFNTLGKCFA